MLLLRILIMSVLFLTGAIATGLVGPNRLAVQQSFSLSYSQYGIGFGVIWITVALAVLLSGGFLRRFNPIRLLRFSLLLMAVGLLVVGLVHDLWATIAGWALAVAGMSIAAVANKMSMDLFPGNPGRGVILLHGFNALGKVIGPLVAAAFVTIAWRYSFIAMAAAPLALAGAALFVHQPRPRAKSVPAEADASPLSHLRDALRSGRFWLVMLGFAMIAGGEAAFATLLPAYFQQVRGMPAATAGVLLTVHLCGLASGRFVAAALVGRLSHNQIIALCLACALFVVPAVLVHQPLILLGSLFLLGLLFSSTWPSFYAQSAAHLHRHRDMLPYGSSLGTAVGVSLCVIISSGIADAWSLPPALFFGPALLVVFGAIYYLSPLSRHIRPAHAPAPAHPVPVRG